MYYIMPYDFHFNTFGFCPLRIFHTGSESKLYSILIVEEGYFYKQKYIIFLSLLLFGLFKDLQMYMQLIHH